MPDDINKKLHVFKSELSPHLFTSPYFNLHSL